MSKIITGTEAIEIAKNECLKLLLKLDEICAENNLRYWIDGGTLLGAIRHEGFIPWDDDIDICLPAPDFYKLTEVLTELCKKDNSYILFHGDTGFNFCFDFFGDISYMVDGVYPVRLDVIPMKLVDNDPESIKIDNSWVNIAGIYYRGFPKSYDYILPEHDYLMPKGKNLIAEKESFFKQYKKYMLDSYTGADEKDKLVYYSVNDFIANNDKGYFEYSTIYPLQRISFEGHMVSAPNIPDNYLRSLYNNYMEIPAVEDRISHLNILHKNDLSKKQVKKVLNAFYKMGFRNFGITNRDKKLYRKWLKVSSLLMVFAKFSIQFQFKSVRNLMRYAKTKVN